MGMKKAKKWLFLLYLLTKKQRKSPYSRGKKQVKVLKIKDFHIFIYKKHTHLNHSKLTHPTTSARPVISSVGRSNGGKSLLSETILKHPSCSLGMILLTRMPCSLVAITWQRFHCIYFASWRIVQAITSPDLKRGYIDKPETSIIKST